MTDRVTEIGKRIAQRQEILKRKNQNDSLLKMVDITELDSFGIRYDFSGSEGEKYLGKPTGEALEEYVQDLEKAINRL